MAKKRNRKAQAATERNIEEELPQEEPNRPEQENGEETSRVMTFEDVGITQEELWLETWEEVKRESQELTDAEREFLTEQTEEERKLRELALKVPSPNMPNPKDKIWRYLIAEYGFGPETLDRMTHDKMKLYIEARQGMAPGSRNIPPEERLLFDDATFTVTLDKQECHYLDPISYHILKAIHEGNGKPVSSTNLLRLPASRAKTFAGN